MSTAVDARLGRVRATIGVALALASLGVAAWLIGRPAGADFLETGTNTARAASPSKTPSSVVVSSMRSVARLADPGTPIPEAAWTLARQPASVKLEEELGHSLLARPIPPPPELRLDSDPGAADAPIGSVAHVDDQSLRVIDGSTNGEHDLQIELRMWPAANGSPRVEAGVWDVLSNEPPKAWSELACEVTLNQSTWNDGDRVVLRYHVRGVDAQGKARDEGGLVRVVVP
ncbi:MAG: hypothetical protein HZA53_10380 [Planctomycetes bacterium]|nr:hypothetical protein [Planctomycetota bacterium]